MLDELVGDGEIDAGPLPILIPEDGFIPTPDADGGVVCGACATPAESANGWKRLALVESVVLNDDCDGP